MKIVIKAEKLSKSYRPHPWGREKYFTLREQFAALFQTPSRRPDFSPVLALQDASFEIRAGERVGIIGHNGAGKSTLLKLLSRVTEPSSGRARIRGRLSALLEVGTGFHQELSGRENIFLYAAIMGARHRDIRKKFDEIVQLAEIERFIDLPVKKYSSGMYVRLAFAAAAHLEPDILVVDEVLAVGDALFQKRSLAKLRENASRTRTVLIVSHNLQLVRSFCERAILIDNGRIIEDGPVEEVLTVYQRNLQRSLDLGQVGISERTQTCVGHIRFERFRAVDSRGEESWIARTGDAARFHVDCLVHEEISGLELTLNFFSVASGEAIASTRTIVTEAMVPAGSRFSFDLQLPDFSLFAGEYRIHAQLKDVRCGMVHDEVDEKLVGLPWLIVVPGDDSPAQMGYVRIPSRVVGIQNTK